MRLLAQVLPALMARRAAGAEEKPRPVAAASAAAVAAAVAEDREAAAAAVVTAVTAQARQPKCEALRWLHLRVRMPVLLVVLLRLVTCRCLPQLQLQDRQLRLPALTRLPLVLHRRHLLRSLL